MSLQEIFDEQVRLNEKINPDLYREIDDPEIKRERFLQFELALRQESAEAIDFHWVINSIVHYIFFSSGAGGLQ